MRRATPSAQLLLPRHLLTQPNVPPAVRFLPPSASGDQGLGHPLLPQDGGRWLPAVSRSTGGCDGPSGQHDPPGHAAAALHFPRCRRHGCQPYSPALLAGYLETSTPRHHSRPGKPVSDPRPPGSGNGLLPLMPGCSPGIQEPTDQGDVLGGEGRNRTGLVIAMALAARAHSEFLTLHSGQWRRGWQGSCF